MATVDPETREWVRTGFSRQGLDNTMGTELAEHVWRPMDTAPKDGRRILGLLKVQESDLDAVPPYRHAVTIIRYDNPDMSGFGEMRWVTDGNGPAAFYGCDLIGWQPLPDVPKGLK